MSCVFLNQHNRGQSALKHCRPSSSSSPSPPQACGSKSRHRCVGALESWVGPRTSKWFPSDTIKPRCEPNESGAVDSGAQSPAFRQRHRERRGGEYGGTCGSGGGGLMWLRAPPAPQQAETLGTQGGGGPAEENNATLQKKNCLMILSEGYHFLLPVECVSCCTYVNDKLKKYRVVFHIVYVHGALLVCTFF